MKKEKKSKEPVDSEEDGGKDSEKKEQFFECKCGKKYGSLAAVHTHINNKHLNQKKEYKMAIKNPKKTGQGPSTSIRMKDIAFNQQEADLMCSSDTALKNLYDLIKRLDELAHTTTSFLLDENVIDSCEELDDDDFDGEMIALRPEGKRDAEIRIKLEQLKDRYKLHELDSILERAKELETFKIDKFCLTMIKELTKFFNVDFASKIHFTLEIITARHKNIDRDLQQQLSVVEAELWGNRPEIIKILNDYYKEWNTIRNKDYRQNAGK